MVRVLDELLRRILRQRRRDADQLTGRLQFDQKIVQTSAVLFVGEQLVEFVCRRKERQVISNLNREDSTRSPSELDLGLKVHMKFL